MAEEAKKKVPHNKLPKQIYQALEYVVGKRWISEKRSLVETYSKLSIEGMTYVRKHNKDATALPACVVLPNSTEEVQGVVKVCNRFGVPFIPFTNGQVFCGTTNAEPTVIIHMSRMNRIIRIDTDQHRIGLSLRKVESMAYADMDWQSLLDEQNAPAEEASLPVAEEEIPSAAEELAPAVEEVAPPAAEEPAPKPAKKTSTRSAKKEVTPAVEEQAPQATEETGEEPA